MQLELVSEFAIRTSNGWPDGLFDGKEEEVVATNTVSS